MQERTRRVITTISACVVLAAAPLNAETTEESDPITVEDALEVPTDPDDADDIRDDNDPEDVGQEALEGDDDDPEDD